MSEDAFKQLWESNPELADTLKPANQTGQVRGSSDEESKSDRLDIALVLKGEVVYIEAGDTGYSIEWDKKMPLNLVIELLDLWSSLGTHLFSGQYDYVTWLLTENKQLEDQTPFAYVSQARSLVKIEALLGRMAYGIMA